MHRWRTMGLLLWASACADEAGEREGTAPRIACVGEPDAATALGVRGVDLWEAFEGTRMLPASVQADNRLSADTVTVTVARTDEAIPGLDDCEAVEVPVRLQVQGAGMSESMAGVLSGTPARGFIVFASEQVEDPRAIGSLTLSATEPVTLRLRVDEREWTSPPLRGVMP